MVTLKRIGWALVAVAVFMLAINLALHFGQIRHNHLGYDVNQQFPAGKPFVPGEIYASTLAAIMDHELHTGFGWRPNDLWPWSMHVMADNNANRQLGIIIALRETMRVFRDNLTKVSSNEYDKNLMIADTDFRNDARRWIFPSAESRYEDGIRHLRAYIAGLHAHPPTSRELNQRNVELVKLFQAWTDLLGDAHAQLYRSVKDDGSPVRPWDVDDYFYQSQGYAAVMYYTLQAVKLEYHQALAVKPVLAQLIDETIDPLGKAAMMKPFIVMNGSPDGLFANHRRNLDAFLMEARQKMYSIRDELSH
jgi:hypothetical protein